MTKKTLLTLLTIFLLTGVSLGEDYDRDREGFVNEYELMHIIADSDFQVGLPNCKIREKHLFEKGTLTKKETKLLKKRYPKDSWHFEFDKDISKCRGCRLIQVVCSGYDYYKSVTKGTTKDGVMFCWFFDFEDNYLLKRIWDLESRIEATENRLEKLEKEEDDD